MQITYQDWSDFLLRVGAICTPAELHGLLCGLQCNHPVTVDWKKIARDYMDLVDEADFVSVEPALEAQYELIHQALSDGQYHLQLLLPDDVLSTAVRADGLASWCQGFLHGFASSGEGLAEKLDQDAHDALRDLAQIAQLDDACDDSDESEQNLMELIEYVRLTLFSIASQLRPVTPLSTNISETRH